MTGERGSLVDAFTLQAGWCADLGSPLYGELLTIAAEDIGAGGPVAGIVAGVEGDPVESALALRFMGGVHRLVLMGVAPELAAHYPSVGGTPSPAALRGDFLATVAQHPWYLRTALDVAPQTNEVGRSVVLLPAILTALDGRRLAVRLLEIGSAAGLNLLLDRFRYEASSWTWGPEDSPAVIRTDWRGDPPVGGRLSVVDRRGCDVHPLDAGDPDARLRILSFVWPDQVDRLARIAGALDLARVATPVVDPSDAGTWLRERLAEPSPRRTMTVVMHSVMWQYLADETRAQVDAALDAAAARATRRSPLAYITFEPDASGPPSDGAVRRGFAVRMLVHPSGESRELGRAQAHGAWVEWNA